MNLLPLVNDNINELLIKIIEFTHIRQKILIQNMKSIHSPGFVPKDLRVKEFCNLINDAINEHIQNHRLVLRDTENIKFSISSSVEVKPMIDEYAKELFEENRDEYFELQINKLLENSINQRIAAELLKQKTVSTDYWTIDYCEQVTKNERIDNNYKQSRNW